jgi:hypothetical protein
MESSCPTGLVTLQSRSHHPAQPPVYVAWIVWLSLRLNSFKGHQLSQCIVAHTALNVHNPDFASQLSKNAMWATYPPSVFRIVTLRRQMANVVAFLSNNFVWDASFPALLIFDGGGTDALRGRPNVCATEPHGCERFVYFWPESTLVEMLLK